jgi:leader peptidase (prepilin peptidase)/N-methyltransferase
VILLVVFSGVLGLVIGSFLNVVIHRVPRGQSIVYPASRCPECGTHISPRDNVPVISYLLLGGRCRRCRTHIPVRYPLGEVMTGALFAGAAYRFGFEYSLVPALVLLGVLVALAGIDLSHRLLPNVIVGPAALAGLVLSVAGEPGRWWVYVASAVAVGGALFALALAYPGGMGMGDVKMGAMLGTFLGPYAALAVFFGALGGALVSGGLMVGGKMGRRGKIPFGTFLAFGGVVALFAGRELWELYLRAVGGL